jgi:hypothetical protein
MESCFSTLKTGPVHLACSPTRDAARHDLRLHSAPEYSTPEQAQRQAAKSGVHQIEGRSDCATARIPEH